MSNWSLPPKGGHMEDPTGVYYQTMNKREVKERLEKNDVIIIPVGSTENHGNAGPIGEDTFIATRIAELVAKKTGCTILEPIWYGSHPFHHIGQPGTIPIPDDVFANHLRAIMSGLWNTGFSKQIFISLHG
jgi:creatinine amidohydrolase/Fe(II)-dependent formamide hydrolase-like protein